MAANRQAKQKRVLEVLRAGNTRRAACAVAGIDKSTFYDWTEKDPTFSAAVEKAEAEAELEAVEIVRQAGREGWQPMAWWLERKRHEDWRRRDHVQQEITGAEGGPVRITEVVVEKPKESE